MRCPRDAGGGRWYTAAEEKENFHKSKETSSLIVLLEKNVFIKFSEGPNDVMASHSKLSERINYSRPCVRLFVNTLLKFTQQMLCYKQS